MQALQGEPACIMDEVFRRLMVSANDKYIGCFVIRHIKTRMLQDHENSLKKKRKRKKEKELLTQNPQGPQLSGSMPVYVRRIPPALPANDPPIPAVPVSRRSLKKDHLDGDSLRRRLKHNAEM